MLRTFSPPSVVAHHDVFIDGLDPRHDGVRIAQLSDLHVGRLTPEVHVRHAVALANGVRADIIVMTGDYVNWSLREIPMMREQLAGLVANRVVATLGNHDYFTSATRVVAGLKSHHYDVLRNQHTTVEINGVPLQVIGIDDPVTRHHDVDRAFRGVPKVGTRIVLCHCPEQAHGVASKGADLILSGHTHGGQIYVGGVTDRLIRRMGKRYRSGFYQVTARSRLYVTSGIGFSGVRVRAGRGAGSEIAVFTLRCCGVDVAA